jgi:predicted O-linked N-acetylglucosamine transferase (SPINDLY family)
MLLPKLHRAALCCVVLCSIPTSRLVLKAKPFSCATARQHIASQLEAAGVAAWRFDLLPLTASTQVCV